MADLIIKMPYTDEKILYADATEEQSLYFTVENPNVVTDPDNPASFVMNIQNVGIYVKSSDIGADQESSIYLYSARPETKVAMVTAGKTNKVICKFTMPDSLIAAMVANGTRSVPVSITVRYYDYGSEHPAQLRNVQALFENVTVLSGKYTPQVVAFSTLRTESGLPSEEGIDVTAKIQLAYAPDAMVSAMDLRLYYAEGRDATVDDEYLSLNSRISTDELNFVLSRQFSNSTDWGFLLYFGDKYENSTASSNIFKAFANMHLSGAANGGVCFGGFSKSTDESPMFECHYPAYFYGGIALGGAMDYPAPGVEQDTGVKWVDGKPIYRAALVGSVNTSGRIQLPQITPCTTIDTIIGISGTAVTPGGSNFMSLPHVSYAGLAYCVGVRAYKSGSGELYIGSQYSSGVDYVIIIEYTRTTDESGTSLLLDSDSNQLTDASGTALAAAATDEVYKLSYTGAQIDQSIARTSEMYTALGGVTPADNGKVLTVVDGKWEAAELPKFDGEYVVVPAIEGQELLTAQKLMDANLKVEKIPYAEASNTANGITATIG